MENSAGTALEVVQRDAKQKALAIMGSDKNCISYVRPEDLETASLFIPVVSIVKPSREDFYDPIPGVGIMAKPALVNLIREKAGIEILKTETEKRGEFVWHAHVYGQKRQPDGSMLRDDASYEFDAEKRSELDVINQPAKYSTEILKRKHLLETAKFGDQRAVTGAQHALIHKMAKCARSFKTPDELMRGMMILRVDRNVNGMLSDPQMRDSAMRNAMGARDELFGPADKPAKALPEPAPRDVTPEDDSPEPGDEAFTLMPETPAADDPVTAYRKALMDWANHDTPDIAQIAEATLGRDETDPEILEWTIKILGYLAGRNANPEGAKYCIEVLRKKPLDKAKVGKLMEKIDGALNQAKKAS